MIRTAQRCFASLSLLAAIGVFAAPSCKPPDPPKPPDGAPAPPPPGNCCLRQGGLVGAKCGGRPTCCASDLDMDACESGGGLWFASPEGCSGAC